MSVHDTVIVGSHVVLSSSSVEYSPPSQVSDFNIVIDDGVISDITKDIPSADTVINCKDGSVCVPGPIDPHVHYGVYSPIDVAAKTESHAASIGGVTTMMRMLRLPDKFEDSLPRHLDAMSTSHYIDYSIHASIFTNEQINGMKFCTQHNVTSFKLYMNLGGEVGHVFMDVLPESDDLSPAHVDVNNDIVRNTVKRAAQLGCPVLVHAEDSEMCGCGIKDAQKNNLDGLSAWSESRPPKSEAKAIQTISKFGREYDCTIYFVHVGSSAALQQIQQERKLGTRIFVETCPHYLQLTHEEQQGYLAKVMPPIRACADRDSVWQSVMDGTVDTIGTDHVANQIELKLGGDDIWDALAGFPGIGTSIPLLLHTGVNSGKITLSDFSRITSYNTARIFGLANKGQIAIGCDADIAILDLKLEKKVTTELFGGFSDYSVYEGMVLKGWPITTMVRGHVVSDDFEVVGTLGHGKMVRRDADLNAIK